MHDQEGGAPNGATRSCAHGRGGEVGTTLKSQANMYLRGGPAQARLKCVASNSGRREKDNFSAEGDKEQDMEIKELQPPPIGFSGPSKCVFDVAFPLGATLVGGCPLTQPKGSELRARPLLGTAGKLEGCPCSASVEAARSTTGIGERCDKGSVNSDLGSVPKRKAIGNDVWPPRLDIQCCWTVTVATVSRPDAVPQNAGLPPHGRQGRPSHDGRGKLHVPRQWHTLSPEKQRATETMVASSASWEPCHKGRLFGHGLPANSSNSVTANEWENCFIS